ncbi:MAG: sigma-54-dependent Fis family transcriptional regulator, partial [Acidobacteriales bacterium]|nr:sigma-54-dependent Fis family transcriptional regulator [Terriglobales bacterium]
AIENARYLERLDGENRRLHEELDIHHSMVGESKAMREVYEFVARVAGRDSTVLIWGESGTGKELVARAVHNNSARKDKPFVAINCAAIPETLIESEIFGHEKGSFTGALERRAGVFELAEGGTLLLDEIGEMPAATQAKLLRVIEDRKLRRLGSKVEQEIDVRVLAATNKNPEQAVADGQLREDLYYRLNVFHIQMPPLRNHKEDLPVLVDALLNDLNAKHGKNVAGVSADVMEMFERYNWPGNVRELRNTMERAVILCGEGEIERKHLPQNFGQSIGSQRQPSAGSANAIHVEVGTTVEEAERQLILRTLESTHNNKTRAAEVLGISLKTLHNKLKEYSQSGLTTA